MMHPTDHTSAEGHEEVEGRDKTPLHTALTHIMHYLHQSHPSILCPNHYFISLTPATLTPPLLLQPHPFFSPTPFRLNPTPLHLNS